MNPVVVLEFNELSPVLMKQFIERGELPNFCRLRDESSTYITEAGVDPPNLEPWIQWVTVHTGLAYRDHQVFNLGDAGRFKGDRLWDIASKNGKKVWVCGSMNAQFQQGLNGAILPDPWSVKTESTSEPMTPYLSFVRAQVQRYDDPEGRLSISKALEFMGFMVANGLRSTTVMAIVKQLFMERVGNAYWRRAFILDRLQFDLFRSYFKRNRPDLSTFFLNSTAHLQHSYWRNHDPDAFEIKPTEEEQKAYGSAVLEGYKSMDRIVGEVIKMAGDKATIVLATALSQQPCLIYEKVGGKTFYKVRDFSFLLRFLSIPDSSCSVEPVMSEEFHVRFSSEAALLPALAAFESLTIENGQSVFKVRREELSLMVGCSIFSFVDEESIVLIKGRKSIRFYELLYHVDSKKSGMHHPDGILWIRGFAKERTAQDRRVKLESVAPTVLGLLGIAQPESMNADRLV